MGQKYGYGMLSLEMAGYTYGDPTDGCTQHYVVTNDTITILGPNNHGHVIKRPESKS